MPVINVPQGRICRLSQKESSKGFTGLYTSGFSTCNIIILFNDDNENKKISLTHADLNISEADIQKEIDWVGQNCKKILIKRDEMGDTVTNICFPTLKNQFETINADLTVDPISVDYTVFNNSSNILKNNEKGKTLYNGIQLYNVNSVLNLEKAYHPKEYEIQSYYINNYYLHPKNRGNFNIRKLLFDGTHWLAPLEHDLKLHAQAEQHYKKYILPGGKTFTGLSQGFINLYMKLTDNGFYQLPTAEQKMIFHCAKYLEYRLDNYDIDAIFVKNVKDILEYANQEHQQKSALAMYYNSLLITAIQNKGSAFELGQKVVNVMKDYVSDKWVNNAKHEIEERIADYNYFKRYEDYKVVINSANNVSNLYKQGVEYFRKKEYQAALKLFNNALETAKIFYHLDKESPLDKIYHLIGACYQEIADYQKACQYLLKACELRQTWYGTDNQFTIDSKNRLNHCENQQLTNQTPSNITPSTN